MHGAHFRQHTHTHPGGGERERERERNKEYKESGKDPYERQTLFCRYVNN
jgi:hypothetical protein